jgi:hypothetical protein
LAGYLMAPSSTAPSCRQRATVALTSDTAKERKGV